MSQELTTAASTTPLTTPEPLSPPSFPRGEHPKSFSSAVYYGVPFDELLEKDFTKMTHNEQRAYLEGIRSARVNPGHKKVEKSTGSKNKGKGSDTNSLLKGLV